MGGDSCVDHCGGSAGMCWCDSYCSSYGDCCADFTEDCPNVAADTSGSDDGMDGMYGYAPPMDGTCDGNCGGYGGSCWCDSYCSDYGDCCADLPEVCPAISGTDGGDYGGDYYSGGNYYMDMPASGGGSCAGNCGGAADDYSCWCDSYCSMYGDCCADFTEDCPAPATYAKKALGPKFVVKAARKSKVLSKLAVDVKARAASKAVKGKARKARKLAVKAVRPTKALSKRPKDVKARKFAKKAAVAKVRSKRSRRVQQHPAGTYTTARHPTRPRRTPSHLPSPPPPPATPFQRSTRQSKVLSKRPIDVDARKATKAKAGMKKFIHGVKTFAKRVVAKKAASAKRAVATRTVRAKKAAPAKKAVPTKAQAAALKKAWSMPAKKAVPTMAQATALKKAWSSKRN